MLFTSITILLSHLSEQELLLLLIKKISHSPPDHCLIFVSSLREMRWVLRTISYHQEMWLTSFWSALISFYQTYRCFEVNFDSSRKFYEYNCQIKEEQMRIFCFWVILLMGVNIWVTFLCIAAFFSSFSQPRGVRLPVADTILKKDLEIFSSIYYTMPRRRIKRRRIKRRRIKVKTKRKANFGRRMLRLRKNRHLLSRFG